MERAALPPFSFYRVGVRYARGQSGPHLTGTSTVTVNSAEAAQTPALGLTVVTLDNKSGGDEAQLIPLK
jgi:hypothetical protein